MNLCVGIGRRCLAEENSAGGGSRAADVLRFVGGLLGFALNEFVHVIGTFCVKIGEK